MTESRDNLASYADRASWVIGLSRALYPVRGLIVSPDLDRAFARIKLEMPELRIHEYESGRTAEDWIVPQSWEATLGSLSNEEGKILASHEESFLFVAPYSEPVDGWFTKAEIAQHLRTRPEVPDAYVLEHRHAYDFRRRTWGITLPHAVWQSMPEDGRYRVRIEVSTAPGSMKVAELTIPGESEETICVCSQFDELCNDGQSSAIAAMDMIRSIASRADRRYTWQILLAPEMFGTLFYIFANPERLARTVGVLNLETLGAGERLVLKASLDGNTWLDRALALAIEGCGLPYSREGFFGGYGNDERVYAWPTVGIPGVGLQRHPFRYYHTSKDTPECLSAGHIGDALRVCDAFVDVVESNYVPRLRGKLQPWLTRRGLYFDHYVEPQLSAQLNNLVLFNVDGRRSLVDLASLSGAPFAVVRDYLERFVAEGLVDRLPPWKIMGTT